MSLLKELEDKLRTRTINIARLTALQAKVVPSIVVVREIHLLASRTQGFACVLAASGFWKSESSIFTP
jgi:uncharacterized membrane protein YqhA